MMFGFLDLLHFSAWATSPLMWLALGFQLWMLVDAVRREEWIWAILIFLFSFITALFYFFLVYRQAPASAGRGFELPGAHDRKRIKELEAQIHHLDKAHHHSQLGDIYLNQGKLAKAEEYYRAALERDPDDVDTQAHLGQCLLRQNKLSEARALLEKVCAENPQHDYGHSLMALAETLRAQGEIDAAIAAWKKVLENHTYPRARVQLAELYMAKHQPDLARTELQEVLSDDAHAPAFQRRRDRVWVHRAKTLVRQVS